MKTHQEWKKYFDNQSLGHFNDDESGVIWLKLKSLIRKDIIGEFKKKNNNIISKTKQDDVFVELYNSYCDGKLSIECIDNFLRDYNKSELRSIRDKFSFIEAELYKLKSFSWGGDSTNSLEKKIVSFVKDTFSYEEINKKIDTGIAEHTRKYTLNSWYNNWSSILTEHIFKTHKNVISAIGKIKSVDFFIKNIPIDLKITYFPKEYLKSKRRDLNLEVEMTFLKKLAKENEVNFDNTTNEDTLKYQIIEQLKNLSNPEITNALLQLKNENASIVKYSISNKVELIKWLYENQGQMRFGAENRLFLILIDVNEMSESWKLKRNFKLLKKSIEKYLDNFNSDQLLSSRITFQFGGKEYNCLSDAIFIKAGGQ